MKLKSNNMPDFHKDEIFYVKCGNEIGTAFLLNEKFLITAFHVVIDSESGDDITIFNDKFGALNAKVHQLVSEVQKKMDIAILEVEKSIPSSNYIKLASSRNIPEGTFWYSRGYISAKGKEGLNMLPVGRNRIVSTYDSLCERRPKHDLDLSTDTSWKSYKGISGSPVMIEGYAYGVVTSELTQDGQAHEISALSTKHFASLVRDLGITVFENDLSYLDTKCDHPASNFYDCIKDKDFDPRSLSEKLTDVCENIKNARLQQYSRDILSSTHELDMYPEKLVKALKYRLFDSCQKSLLNKIEDGLSTELSVREIEKIIDDFTDDATKVIAELSKDYNYPITNRESIRKAILLLADDCYWAFDETGLYEED